MRFVHDIDPELAVTSSSVSSRERAQMMQWASELWAGLQNTERTEACQERIPYNRLSADHKHLHRVTDSLLCQLSSTIGN